MNYKRWNYILVAALIVVTAGFSFYTLKLESAMEQKEKAAEASVAKAEQEGQQKALSAFVAGFYMAEDTDAAYLMDVSNKALKKNMMETYFVLQGLLQNWTTPESDVRDAAHDYVYGTEDPV